MVRNNKPVGSETGGCGEPPDLRFRYLENDIRKGRSFQDTSLMNLSKRPFISLFVHTTWNGDRVLRWRVVFIRLRVFRRAKNDEKE